MKVSKLSISLDPRLGSQVRKAARKARVPVSVWLAQAAAAKLRADALGAFLDDWEGKHGKLAGAFIAVEGNDRSMMARLREAHRQGRGRCAPAPSGRWIDNVFIERLWRSVKYEDIYLRAYENGRDLKAGLTRYLDFYNRRRIHQSHGYRTPDEIYYATEAGEPLAIAA